MKIITKQNAAEYQTWWAMALNDDGVWPYLAMSPRYLPFEITDDDWERRLIMDATGMGCCGLSFGRHGDHSVSISLWVLTCSSRALIAALLLRNAIALASRYDIRWIDSGCHESNELSRKAHENFFGAPWGIEPASAWNAKTRKYEGRFCFRVAASEIEKRFTLVDEVAA